MDKYERNQKSEIKKNIYTYLKPCKIYVKQ